MTHVNVYLSYIKLLVSDTLKIHKRAWCSIREQNKHIKAIFICLDKPSCLEKMHPTMVKPLHRQSTTPCLYKSNISNKYFCSEIVEYFNQTIKDFFLRN